MRPGPDDRWFFVHVMKTGGTTVRALFERNHEPHELYPCPLDKPTVKAKVDPQHLRTLTPERLDQIHIFTAHVPVTARELLPYPTRTMTVLREPVERTISWLRQNQRIHSPDASLEAIYEVDQARRAYSDEHQTRMFAVRTSDQVNSFTNYVAIDEQRFAEAKQRLDETDMVGFQDDLAHFMDAVVERFGYPRRGVPDKNVATGSFEVSEALRRRIVDDNPYDLAFYEYAKETRARSG